VPRVAIEGSRAISMFRSTPMNTRYLCAAACLFTALAVSAGCTRVYKVKVDAMQNPEVRSGESYRLVLKDPARAGDDPSQQRAEKMVRQALAAHGMYEAPKAEEAEVTVEISCEVGPMRVLSEQVDPMIASLGVPVVPADRRIVRDADGRTIGVTDHSAVVLRKVYEKKLTIVAREGPASTEGSERPPRELWRVEVKVEDEQDDVDEVLPVLVGAAVDHIGKDSTTQQTKRLSDQSEPVTFIKSGS